MISKATSWADTTEVSASAVAARLKAVVVDLQEDAAGEVYVQFWDNADPTPGTTATRMVLPVPRTATIGKRRRVKYVFPGGLVFGTALTWFVGTTPTSGTGATTNAPLVVTVHYERL